MNLAELERNFLAHYFHYAFYACIPTQNNKLKVLIINPVGVGRAVVRMKVSRTRKLKPSDGRNRFQAMRLAGRA